MRTNILSKRDIEELLDSYDSNPEVALAHALAKIVDTVDSRWEELVGCVPESVAARQDLINREITALDAVVKHLVENRRLEK